LQANDNSMTFLNYADTVSSPFKWMNMINKAGKLVLPSIESVQAAMDDFSEQFDQSNFTIDIIDADGNASWPIAYMNYLSMQQNLTTFDCTNIFELLSFVAWVQTNDAYVFLRFPPPIDLLLTIIAIAIIDRASQEARNINVAPIDVSLRERLIGLLNTVECNGKTAYETTYLVGAGTPLPLMTSWAVSWSSQLSKMKYFEGTSSNAKQQLSSGDVLFGVVGDGLSAEWYAKMSDAAIMPLTAYALVPAYNIPELNGLELVLDFDTVAGIYLNEITYWDDPRIQALNSAEVVAALPSQPIVVITQSIAVSITSAFTTALSATVPEFAAQVGSGELVTFPVQSAGNRSIVLDNVNTINSLRDNEYSFAFWANYEVRQVRCPLPLPPPLTWCLGSQFNQCCAQARKIGAAAMKNSAGRVVSPTSESLISALSDYEASGQTSFESLLLCTPSKAHLGLFLPCNLPLSHSLRRTTAQHRARTAGPLLRLPRSSITKETWTTVPRQQRWPTSCTGPRPRLPLVR
jgi:ABC-type phosphate transport system substrate-binding protein